MDTSDLRWSDFAGCEISQNFAVWHENHLTVRLWNTTVGIV